MASGRGHFQSYFLNSKCSDVTLCVTLNDERCLRIPSHKFVLASGSPVFEKMLEKDKFKEGRSGVAKIAIPGGELIAREFVRFFYFGNVQISSLEGGLALMKAAHLYDVERLIRISENIILESLSPDTACLIYEETKEMGSPKYSDEILFFILRSAFVIFNKLCHLSLSEEAMTTILKSDLLNVVSEKQAAEAIWSWGRWKSLAEGKSSGVIDVSQRIQFVAEHVRWGLLKADDFTNAEPAWEHLAAANSENSTVRKSGNVPSLINFCRSFDLKDSKKDVGLEDLCPNEREKTSLYFSCDKDLLLIAFDLNLFISYEIFQEIYKKMELKLDQDSINSALGQYSSFNAEVINGLSFVSAHLLLEFDKPVRLKKTFPHEITMKVLCDGGKVRIKPWKVSNILSFPGNENRDSVNFTIHKEKVSVKSLYCFC